ncbi:hypothetical protein PA598K_04772 [Paenibacillus sp. 598K]|uniref:hypothetical protein n=1 Tax=Paenibacillus sp. 598K TaxID=1117987 RepID=UPI000FFA54AE|nr:hypothetical protein [Paenibacillus sp. 598K]GBF76313.1 hypothetical protein PA598K_04772 [Paenibacillus sp. 598K]
MKKVMKVACTTVLAVSLLAAPIVQLGGVSVVYAQDQQKLKAFPGVKLKTFMISSNSYIQLKDVYFQYKNGEKIVHFTAAVHNGDKREIDFLDYWVDLYGINVKYKLTANPTNKKNGKVASQSTEEFKFYASVNPKLNYADLRFRVIKWDLNASNYERAIGSVNVPANYANTVPEHYSYVLRQGTEKLQSYVRPSTTFKLGDQTQFQVTYRLENIGLMSKELAQYQFYLRTKLGYMVKLTPDYAADAKLEPGDGKDLVLAGSVRSNVDLAGAQLYVIQQEGEEKFERPLAMYKIPWSKTTSFVTPSDKSKVLTIDGERVEQSISEIYAETGDQQDKLVMTVKWVNKGTKSVTLPKYKLELQSAKGERYPVALPAEDLVLAPNLTQEVTLQANVPAKVEGGWTLLVHQPAEENKSAGYVLAALKLPGIQTDTSSLTRKTYRDARGTYVYGVDAIERLPWGDQDIVNIYVSVENKGTKDQVLPQIQPSVKWNGAELSKEAISFMRLDSKMTLPLEDRASYVISTKIPYTSTMEKLDITLSEPIKEDQVKTLTQFTVNSAPKTPRYNIDKPYTVTSFSRNASLKFHSTYEFEGRTSKLFYVEFSYKNNESRFAQLPTLQGFFRTKSGQVVEAQITPVKDQISPTGEALVIASAKVPKSFDRKELEFIVGEAVTAGKPTTGEDKPDGWMQGAFYELPDNTYSVKNDFLDLELNPYVFSLTKTNAGITGNSALKLDLTYNLSDSEAYESSPVSRELLFEVVEGTNHYEQKVALQGEEALKKGENQTHSLTFTGQNISRVITNGYTINIYEQYEGHRRLLASKKFNQFTVAPAPAPESGGGVEQ